MDAIVTAGGIPKPEEPLYEYTQGTNKAMLDILGKPMVQWVLDALEKADLIDSIILVGLTEDEGLVGDKIKAYIPNQGEMLANARAGMEKVREVNPQAELVLFVSSDIPGIQPEIVDWIIENSTKLDADLYYHVVEKKVMEERYPESKRSYTRLKDVEVCGADLNIARILIDKEQDSLWERLFDARKSVVKQASLIGWDTLFLLLTRQVTLEKAARRVSKKIHLRGEAVLCPYAEVAMDVDKPFQYEILRADLEKQRAGGG